MILFPNAKINIGLNIIAKRLDGFHDIETCFIPIGLCDILEIAESENIKFESSGIKIPGNPMENLCVDAWKLMHEYYKIPPVTIRLHKQIPVGGGLGGGSSDAAFMLKGLSDYFNIQINSTELKNYASKLGSDCSFFIDNKPAFAKGKGEILELIDVNLNGYKICLINPGIHIPTKDAYASIRPKYPRISLMEILKMPVEEWTGAVINDFEAFALKTHPMISAIKEKLVINGAIFSLMTGSGSSVFGIFKNQVPKNIVKEFSGMFVWIEE